MGTSTKGSQVETTSQYELDVINPFPSTSPWTPTLVWGGADGEVIIGILQDLEDYTHYDFAFVVRNGPSAQSAVSVTLLGQISRVSTSTVLGIDVLTFGVKTIRQSSPFPCALNVITISLQTSVSLLDTCGDWNGSGEIVGDGVYPTISMRI